MRMPACYETTCCGPNSWHVLGRDFGPVKRPHPLAALEEQLLSQLKEMNIL